MSRTVRPRRGRMVAVWTSVAITAVSVLGGVGALPTTTAGTAAAAPPPSPGPTAVDLVDAARAPQPVEHSATMRPTPEQPSPDPAPDLDDDLLTVAPGLAGEDRNVDRPGLVAGIEPVHPVPSDSGEGRRIVFDMSDQRVWLVDGREVARRTYLVSGSLYDNLSPGTYSVYSRSRHAVGIDDSGTMEFMVRFTRGERAAIGFHSIPVHRGEKVQTVAELGTPLSIGCVRQRRSDARALWDFAPVGTSVVVTA